MPSFLNLKILGHPINVAMIVGLILLVWVSFYVLHRRGVIPAPAADNS